jgi:cytochrome c oxidase assembly factor CtaG
VTGHDMAGHGSGVAGMVVMGLLTSVVAPLLVLAGRRRRRPDPAAPRVARAAAILLGFEVLHAGIVLLTAAPATGTTAHVLAHATLLAGAVLFWLPVLGHGATRLPDAGRSVYLFLACPLLDLAAVALVVRGDEAAGVAMIVAMLPVALAAVVVTWRWIAVEERAARAADGPAAVGAAPGGGWR